MALNFDRPTQALKPELTLEPAEVKPYDIMEDRDRTGSPARSTSAT